MPTEANVSKSSGNAGQFLRETKGELKKVQWTTRKELTKYTWIVILTTLVISFFLWIVDSGLGFILKSLAGK